MSSQVRCRDRSRLFANTEQFLHFPPQTDPDTRTEPYVLGVQHRRRPLQSPLSTRVVLSLLTAASLGQAFQTTYKVATEGGTHATLQMAVDACPAFSGCRIELADSVYLFSKPVTIRGKSNISIVGARPNGIRPILRIDSAALVEEAIPNIGSHAGSQVTPLHYREAATPDTLVDLDGIVTIRTLELVAGAPGKLPAFLLAAGIRTNASLDPSRPRGWMASPYDQAFSADASLDARLVRWGYVHSALLLVDSSRHVSVSGLEFDGGVPVEFTSPYVWGGRTDLFGGIAAIVLSHSLDGQVTGCVFHGWSAALRTLDDNPGGVVSDLLVGKPGFSSRNLSPLSNPGTMGGHRFEDNAAYDNHNVVHFLSSMDLASNIRFNRAWENGLSRMLVAQGRTAAPSATWSSFRGGFLYTQNESFVPHIVQGNTLVRNSSDLIWGDMCSYGIQFFDNVAVRRDTAYWNSYLTSANNNLRSNWFADVDRVHGTFSSADSIVPFCDNDRCEPLTPGWGTLEIDMNLVGRGRFGDDLGALWHSPRKAEPIRVQDQTLGFASRDDSGWNVVLPVPLEATASIAKPHVIKPLGQYINSSVDARQAIGEHLVPLSSLEGLELQRGINVLQFHLPAKASDSLWRVEMAIEGTDINTGRKVHSNLGIWLVRPLGKQLQITRADTGAITPGQTVRFLVDVKDSYGQDVVLSEAPTLNAEGWTIASSDTAPSAARKASGSSRFLVQAIAPSTVGISQVFFHGNAKDDSSSILAGAIYVQIETPSFSSPKPTPLPPAPAPWRVASISRTSSNWRLGILDADETALSSALLHSVSGQAWKPVIGHDGTNPSLLFPLLGTGTYFLRIGGVSTPVVLP